MFKTLSRAAVAAALLAATTGCYSMALNANGVSKPVSLSAQIGRPSTLDRHFKYEMITWYGVGLIPLATVPGAPNAATPADKLVKAILDAELAKGGDGIVNLRVVHEVSPMSFLASVVLGAGGLFIPVVGPIIGSAFHPRGVTIEGDIVRFTGGARRSALPGGVITKQAGQIDLNGTDLRALVVEASQDAER